MRMIQGVFAIVFLFTSVLAFAHGKDKMAAECSSYETTCKTDASVTGATDKKGKWKAMHECVKSAAAADTANGAACTAAMDKPHKGGHHKGADTGAAAAPAEGAGN